MIEIAKEKNGDVLTLTIKGELDINTSPKLKAELDGELDGVMTIIFDLKDTNYTSSAGLRVLLGAYQQMEAKEGRMLLRHVNEGFKSILKLTGFSEFLEIED